MWTFRCSIAGIITVKPATATIAQNQTQQFTATEFDQFGNAMSSQPASFHWSVASGDAGSISAAGLYTPTATGPATITATFGSFEASAGVTVTAANSPPTVATKASATPSPVTGTHQPLRPRYGRRRGGKPDL